MIETHPTPAMTDTELEAWFAEAGLAATVVDHCSAPTCRLCSGTSGRDLAEAA